MNIARKLGNSTKDRTAYPEVIESLQGSDLTDLGKSFIDDTQFLRTGKQYFIDKMPNNFSHIGLIKLAPKSESGRCPACNDRVLGFKSLGFFMRLLY